MPFIFIHLSQRPHLNCMDTVKTMSVVLQRKALLPTRVLIYAWFFPSTPKALVFNFFFCLLCGVAMAGYMSRARRHSQYVHPYLLGTVRIITVEHVWEWAQGVWSYRDNHRCCAMHLSWKKSNMFPFDGINVLNDGIVSTIRLLSTWSYVIVWTFLTCVAWSCLTSKMTSCSFSYFFYLSSAY